MLRTHPQHCTASSPSVQQDDCCSMVATGALVAVLVAALVALLVERNQWDNPAGTATTSITNSTATMSTSSQPSTTQQPTIAQPVFLPTDTYTPSAPRLQIVGFGDSLTQYGSTIVYEPNGEVNVGWLHLLSHTYSRKADIINRGYSGYNTRTGLKLLQDHLQHGTWPTQRTSSSSEKTQILVTLWFGANDACLKDGSSPQQYVSLQQYEHNLRTIIQLLEKSAADNNQTIHFVLLTPPALDVEQWSRATQQKYNLAELPEPSRSTDNTLQYVEVVRKLGSDLKLPVVDLWKLTSVDKSQSSNPNLSDGLHLSAAGQHTVYTALLQAITQHYPHLLPDKITSLDAPVHAEADKVLQTGFTPDVATQ